MADARDNNTPRPRWRWWLFNAAFALGLTRLAGWAITAEMAGDGGAKCGEGAPF